MPFKFGETTTALDNLAALWLQADAAERLAITQAAHRIEQILRRSADTAGVPYPFGNLPTARRIDEPPIFAVFAFLPSVGQVSVIDYFALPRP
ncbi:MAG TPA: hypothetical protein VGF55_20325 [Gemmataceae bacterium]